MSKIEQTELIALIDRLDKSSLAYLSYHQGEVDLVLAKEMPQAQPNPIPSTGTRALIEEETASTPATSAESKSESSNHSDTAKESEQLQSVETTAGQAVTSPIVGVVYLQAKPGEPPYVKVGDQVEAGQTVCIVEAMKMMNEIPAPISGTVTEVCIENEQVVEFNQVLIRIQA